MSRIEEHTPAGWATTRQPIPQLEFDMRVAQLGVSLDVVEVLTPKDGGRMTCPLVWDSFHVTYIPRLAVSPSWYIYDVRVRP